MTISFKEFMADYKESHDDWGWFVDTDPMDETTTTLPKSHFKSSLKSLYKLNTIKSLNSVTSLDDLEKNYGYRKEVSWSLNTSCLVSLIAIVILIL